MWSPGGPLRAFSNERRPSRQLATSALRLTFVAMFLAQVAVAVLVVTLILLLGDSPSDGGSPLGPVLAVLAFLQCLLGVTLPDALARSGSKGSVLSATLLAAVLLATPAWFLMLALVTGQRPLPLTLLLLAALTAYGLGFVLCGRLGARVAVAARREEPQGQREL